MKICGITRQQDATLATSAGADAVGFVLWPSSPRAISAEAAGAIATSSPFVARVGVFVNQSPDEVARAVKAGRLSAVQLHGDETVAGYARVGAPVIKAVTLKSDLDVAAALALPADVTVLIDASDAVRRGGTGKVADWALASEVSRRRPVILAGGISAANVHEAVTVVRPWAIDVSSGVETGPGVKSEERMRDLFAAVNETRAEGR